MEDYVQFSAKTKGDAITKACIELGISSDQLEYEVVSEGSAGFFGIGSKPAVIRARKKAEFQEEEDIKSIIESVSLDSIKNDNHKKEAPKKEKPVNKPVQKKAQPAEKTEKAPAPKEAPKEEAPVQAKEKPERQEKPVKEKEHVQKEKPVKEKQPKEKPQELPKEKPVKEKPVKVSKPIEIITDEAEIKEIEERAVVFLKDVFASMELGEVDIKSVYDREEGCLNVDFEGDDMGVLIGKRGQTLDSLQYLTSLVVNKGKENYIRVKLDTEDYRRRRKETLENLAKGIAYKVKKTRKPVVLEPMNPYERRIIHSALQGNKYVETLSEGEEPYRHIVVKMKRN